MKKHEAEKLIAVIRELSKDMAEDRPLKAGEVLPVKTNVGEVFNGPQGIADPYKAPAAADVDFEVLYQKVKRRLLNDLQVDPIFVKLLATQPEIMVEIEPRIVTIDGSSLKGRVARLMAAGWFKEARKSGAVRSELTRTGNDPGSGGRLSEALSEYVIQGFLTREGEAYMLAPGVKVSEKVLEVV